MSGLLSVQSLRVSFAGREVVHGLDFGIREGEKLALVGESGSGKSVTALSLLRLAQGARVTGRALFQGEDLLRMPLTRLQGVRGGDIGLVFQEPMTALNPLMTVGDQVAEVLELKRGLSARQALSEAMELLAQTGITEVGRRARHYPHQLSGGQRQRVMIAMALACRPRLLLADEPTTALDVAVRGQILDLLADWQARHGMAVMMITHDLPLVRRFADQVLVLQNGHKVEEGGVEAVLQDPQHAYTRTLVESHPKRHVRLPSPDDSPILQAQQLGVRYKVPGRGGWAWLRSGQFEALRDVHFELRRGQTLAVVGESGSGKSSLAMACLSLLSFEGQVRLGGQAWHASAARQRPWRRRIQAVFQDPFSSLSPRMTVEELVGEGLDLHAGLLSPVARRQRILKGLRDVGLDEHDFPGLLQRYPHEFSGGQRQRIALARALVLEPEVLVLDEPTSALDVSIQRQVLDLLQTLQRDRQLAYLLITHDLAVVQAMAHQVLVLEGGRVVESGALDEVLQQPQSACAQALVQHWREDAIKSGQVFTNQ